MRLPAHRADALARAGDRSPALPWMSPLGFVLRSWRAAGLARRGTRRCILDCTLGGAAMDDVTHRVGIESSGERCVTLQGAGNVADAGPLGLACREGSGHTDTLPNGTLTVIGVASVNWAPLVAASPLAARRRPCPGWRRAAVGQARTALLAAARRDGPGAWSAAGAQPRRRHRQA